MLPKRSLSVLMTLLLALLLATAAIAQEDDDDDTPPISVPQAVQDGLDADGIVPVFVTLDTSMIASGASEEARAAAVSALQTTVFARVAGVSDLQVRHQFTTVAAFSADVTQTELEILINSPEVAAISAIPRFSGSLDRAVAYIEADDAYANYGVSGDGVVVAVVDSGVDLDHPQLVDDIVTNGVCFNQGNPRGSGECPPSDTVSSNFAQDSHGHGTHVAGIITANREVYTGVAPDAQIVPVRVLGADNGGWGDDILAGLQWVYDNRNNFGGINLVNMSLGTNNLYSGACDSIDPYLSAYSSLIGSLQAAGITVFAATGNDADDPDVYVPNTMGAPACFTNTVAVGALGTYVSGGDYDLIANYSNYGTMLDIYAPGTYIQSTDLDGDFESLSGTSMATPMTTGAAALVLECDPTLTPAQLKSVLTSSGPGVYDARNGLTRPRVDVNSACAAIVPAPTITSAAPPDGLLGTPYSHSFAASGAQPISYAVTAGTLPPGLALTGDTISGTPTTAGDYSGITVTATNASGTDTQTFSISIHVPPTITSGTPPDGLLGTAYSHSFSADGTTPITFAVTAGTLPPGLALTGDTISGTPTTAGDYSGITVTATNAYGTDTQTFSITISAAPTITSGAPVIAILDAFYAHQFTATGSTPISYAVTAGTLPPGLSFSGDTISGTPTVTGVYSGIEVTATNAYGTDTQTVTIEVQAVVNLTHLDILAALQNNADQVEPVLVAFSGELMQVYAALPDGTMTLTTVQSEAANGLVLFRYGTPTTLAGQPLNAEQLALVREDLSAAMAAALDDILLEYVGSDVSVQDLSITGNTMRLAYQP